MRRETMKERYASASYARISCVLIRFKGTTLSLPALRRQLGRFERLVAKNAEQRGKFPDDPSRWVLTSLIPHIPTKSDSSNPNPTSTLR